MDVTRYDHLFFISYYVIIYYTVLLYVHISWHYFVVFYTTWKTPQLYVSYMILISSSLSSCNVLYYTITVQMNITWYFLMF